MNVCDAAEVAVVGPTVTLTPFEAVEADRVKSEHSVVAEYCVVDPVALYAGERTARFAVMDGADTDKSVNEN